MRSAVASPIEYAFILGEKAIPANALIGTDISIHFLGEIQCVTCGRPTKKSFSQGHCYPCFRSHPECSPCIIRPEQCRAQDGEGRDPKWEIEHHLQPHTVYFAVTSSLKVGVTRTTNLQARWIDQGAIAGISFAETDLRYAAGLLEVELKQYMSDRTDWRKMLTQSAQTTWDLSAQKAALSKVVSFSEHSNLAANDDVTYLEYPGRLSAPPISSVTLDKRPEVRGRLMGIKGQYLLFTGGTAFSLRKHQGYLVEFVTQ